MANSPPAPTANRLMSLDAYRGFIMLAMASSGLGFAQMARNQDFVAGCDGTAFERPWRLLWQFLGYQFDHVAWTGCSFWDLIQPSFMFMVGVAMPFSYSRRVADGQSPGMRLLHVIWRSFVLIVLGVFLSSIGRALTNYTFVNVLTQIGLGYTFLYLLSQKPESNKPPEYWFKLQLCAATAIGLTYWGWFAMYSTPSSELTTLQAAVRASFEKKAADTQKRLDDLAQRETAIRQELETETTKRAELERELAGIPAKRSDLQTRLAEQQRPEADWSQFEGFAAHWNKHTNAAAAVDRVVLNWVPREGDPFQGRKFWFNDGGYQTLNFIPSLVTMILGLMAGQTLRSDRTERQKLNWLLKAGGLCFLIVLPIDTTIWPWPLSELGLSWSLCPSVKRIWTPTWAVFSSGWTFWILAAFYWVIDIRQWRLWSWPLVVVGMNSIAMYCLSQTMRGWLRMNVKTHTDLLGPLTSWIGRSMFDERFAWSPFFERCGLLLLLWLICVWLYRQRIFIRI